MSKVPIQTIAPFSNGTEAMCWLEDNCDRCVKAYVPKDGEDMPDYETTQQFVNTGQECRYKFHVDMGFITGEIPLDVAEEMGYTEEKGFPNNCLHFSDNDNDRYNPDCPKIPYDPNQLVLPFAFEELENQQKQVVNIPETV